VVVEPLIVLVARKLPETAALSDVLDDFSQLGMPTRQESSFTESNRHSGLVAWVTFYLKAYGMSSRFGGRDHQAREDESTNNASLTNARKNPRLTRIFTNGQKESANNVNLTNCRP
jgi:hypothetical protein